MLTKFNDQKHFIINVSSKNNKIIICYNKTFHTKSIQKPRTKDQNFVSK